MQAHTFLFTFLFKKGVLQVEGPGTKLLFGECGISLKILPSL
jgi:hypothetical protein